MEYELKESILPIKPSYTPLEKIFATRGIDPANIQHYLNTTDADVLDPALVANIHRGAQMLIKHLAAGDKIFIQVDSDCDGFTSAACLINYLNRSFPGSVQNNIIYRLHPEKTHGLIYETIPKDVKLAIAPDSSSNDYECHKRLAERGCDVLVIDHHEAEKISEYACVINNQLCDYPTKSLSGVGMVYKFCQYLDRIMGVNYADDFLDLVALGLVGDMMDLRDYETKHLIFKGIHQKLRNPFIKEMVSVQDYSISKNGGLCPFTMSFYIVPQINGTIRMGNVQEQTILFESMLDFKGYEQIPSTKRGCKGQYEMRVTQACRMCSNLKKKQSTAVDDSLGMIEQIIEEKHLTDNKVIAVKLDKHHSIDRNLTGLIANQLMAKYQHPVLILTEVENEDGSISWMGSGRGYNTSNFADFKDFLNDSGYALLAQGHQNAFGAGFKDEDFVNFINYSNDELKDCDFTPCTKVDFIWHPQDFTGRDVLNIAELNTLWGQEFDKPIVALENIAVNAENTTLMGKGTMKIKLSNGVSLIKFGVSEEEFEKLVVGQSTTKINALGSCKMNEWNGNITPQIELTDYEITGTVKYYF